MGAIGVPMKVHATGMLANVADPAVIELRYDASLFDGSGRPARRPGGPRGEARRGADAPYTDIPTCLGRGAMPLGAISCLDRLREPHRGRQHLVMVVRTTTTSSWIIH